MIYRKYLEPEYGEVDRYVKKELDIHGADMKSQKARRVRSNFETLSELTEMIRDTYCYEDIMAILTDDYRVKNPEGNEILLRVYHPEGKGPFPIMLFYHGGGWTMNNLDLYDYVPRYFACYGGIVVVAVDYRLAPEYKFPCGLNDCYLGLEWAVDHAKEINGSTESVTVCGDSAGGNFAAAITIMSRDRKGPKIHKQIMLYPATSFNFDKPLKSAIRYGGGDYFIKIDPYADTSSMYLPNADVDRLNPYASPMEENNFEGIAPACFISPECDPLLDQALMYAAKLEDNGVPVEFHLYKGMLHAFINRPYQKSFEAMDDIIAAVPKLE
jgi:acetyl esterase